MLKFTVITVCLNAAPTIESTIQSVVGQDYPQLEYIIMDGLSTDGTMEIINRYKQHVSVVRSEPDKGIYDAMNKAVSIATGDVIYFLNADDAFINLQTISNMVNFINQYPDKGMYFFKVNLCHVPNDKMNKNRPHFTDSLTSLHEVLCAGGVCHQRVVARRSVFDQAGDFNIALRVFADVNWVLKALKKGIVPSNSAQVITHYNFQGISANGGLANTFEKALAVATSVNCGEFLLYSLYALRRLCGV